MHILVTGASGLVGKRLCRKLLEQGHNITVLGRSSEDKFRQGFTYPCKYLTWEGLKRFHFDSSILEKPDVVIHLAGESIAGGSWTKKKKERIYNSRVDTTRKFCQFLIKNNLLPEVFISASAIGFYGESKSGESFSESSVAGTGFLSNVCRDWESSSKSLEKLTRLVHLRIGLVFDCNGGFLKEMEPIFDKGLGGKIAGGQQVMSWIHLNDLVEVILFAINNKKIKGPVNAVSPNPVTNKIWTKAFAKYLKRPAIFSVPKLALKIGLGEKSILALQSQSIEAKKLIDFGFKFNFPDLDSALSNLYSWRKKAFDQLYFTEQWVEKNRVETFKFFSEANNLEKITPPELNFKIVKMSTETLCSGTVIDYQLKIHGVPAKWQTLILDWNPPAIFSDNQEKGPYSKWYHTHKFLELKSGTLMEDKIVYRLPFGILGSFIASSFVRGDIRNIFSYRKKIIKENFT